MENASIIVATRNRGYQIKKNLDAMIYQDFPGKHEVIVVNDGSTDNTKRILDSIRGIRTVHLERSHGPAFARNRGFDIAKYPIIVVMDDDCKPEKKWLKKLLEPFKNKKIGISSSYSMFGGTSTAYRKKALDKTGFFDESFDYPHREDTDLVFRIQDLGYDVVFVDSNFEHKHKTPKTLSGKVRYGLKRIKFHHADCLLYKKHRERSKEFMGIKYGFLIDPKRDFKTATGLWSGSGKIKLSSPQGVVLIENKSILDTISIIALGIAYVILVKTSRLYGSIKYRKLLL